MTTGLLKKLFLFLLLLSITTVNADAQRHRSSSRTRTTITKPSAKSNHSKSNNANVKRQHSKSRNSSAAANVSAISDSSFDAMKLESLLSELTTTSDTHSTLTRIRDYYQSLNVSSKKEMRDYMVDKIATFLDNEKKVEGLSVINVYYNLADKNDEKLPTLLFLEGAIYAERMDTINLQRTIDKLRNLPANDEANQYVTQLKESEKDIQNKMSPQSIIKGWWVARRYLLSSKKSNDRNMTQLSCSDKQSPDILLNVDMDNKTDTAFVKICKYSFIRNDISLDSGINYWSKKKDLESQCVRFFSSDSLYVLWSSEKINRNGVDITPFLRGAVSATAATISAELAQKNIYNFSERLAGNMTTSLGEIGLNAMISSIFTPSKKMYTLEARLKIHNDFLLTGMLIYNLVKVNEAGQVITHNRFTTHVRLVKWLPQSNFVFIRNYNYSPLMHYDLNNQKTLQKEFKKNKNTRYAYSKKRYRAYNHQQYKWMEIYNDSIMRTQGQQFALKHRKGIGISIKEFSYKIKEFGAKDIKRFESIGNRGVYLQNVFANEAGDEAGLKVGDIITDINGNIINNKGDYVNILSNHNIGDWLNIKVLRGKKELIIPVRMTWEGD